MLSELDKNILNKLVAAEDYLSGAFLSQICNVSINTIRKEVDIINDHLKGHGCRIETKIAMGYLFVVQDEPLALPFIDRTLLEFRRFGYLNLSELDNSYYILRKLLSCTSFITIDQLMEELYCSKSTVLRLLNNVRDILSLFQLTLKSRRNHGFMIDGNEMNRRICLLFQHKIWRHSSHENHTEAGFEALFMINSAYPESLRKILYAYFSNHPQLSLPQIDLPKLFNFLILSKTRSAYTDQLFFQSEQIKTVKALPAYAAAQEIILLLPEYFQNDMKEKEILAFAMMIAAYQSRTSLEQLSPEDKENCIKEAQEVLSFLQKYFDIRYLFDDQLLKELALELYSTKIRLLFNIPYDRERAAPSTRLGLVTNDLCALLALYYYQRHSVFLHESDLLNFYFIFNRSIYENQTFFNPQRIVLVSRYGIYFTQNLASRIQRLYGSFFNEIRCVEFSDLKNLDYNQVDLLATDITDLSSEQTGNASVITISFERSSRDLIHLQKYIAQIYQKASLQIFKEECLHKVLFSDRNSIYRQLYQYFKDEVGDEEHFIEDLKLRESFISAERDKGIVLITPLALRLNQPVFHLIVSKKPFPWQHQRCSVFIFYQQGDGSKQNTQLISYLLKQFIHQSEYWINSLYRLGYKDIVKSFH